MPSTGWSAKRFFLSEFKTKKLVVARKEGLTWRELEAKYNLKDMHGMSAYRIYRWAKKSPTQQEKMRTRIRKHIEEGVEV